MWYLFATFIFVMIVAVVGSHVYWHRWNRRVYYQAHEYFVVVYWTQPKLPQIYRVAAIGMFEAERKVQRHIGEGVTCVAVSRAAVNSLYE